MLKKKKKTDLHQPQNSCGLLNRVESDSAYLEMTAGVS